MTTVTVQIVLREADETQAIEQLHQLLADLQDSHPNQIAEASILQIEYP